MRGITLLDNNKIGIGSLGTDNLEKAKILVSRALNIPLDKFESRNSDYYGEYYKFENIKIYYCDDDNKKYRIYCDIGDYEQANKIILYYNSILVKGKPKFE